MKTDVCMDRLESVKGLRCVLLNTNIFPVVDVGMYNSFLSPSLYEENEKDHYVQMHRGAAEFVCLGDFKWNRYKDAVVEAAMNYIEAYAMDRLRQYGVATIRPKGINSPKEYNFSDDSLDLYVYLTPDFDVRMRGHIADMRKNPSLQCYIEEHYWSKSGFWSWMPKSFDEIEAMEDEERCVGAYLTLALLQEGYWSRYGRDEDDSNMCIADAVSCAYGDEFCNIYLYVSDELLALYRDDAALNNLLWDVYFRIGRPWRGHKPKNSDYVGECKCEAVEFLLWAADNEYSLADLRAIAA